MVKRALVRLCRVPVAVPASGQNASRGGLEGIYRSSLDARKPQNPINGVLRGCRGGVEGIQFSCLFLCLLLLAARQEWLDARHSSRRRVAGTTCRSARLKQTPIEKIVSPERSPSTESESRFGSTEREHRDRLLARSITSAHFGRFLLPPRPARSDFPPRTVGRISNSSLRNAFFFFFFCASPLLSFDVPIRDVRGFLRSPDFGDPTTTPHSTFGPIPGYEIRLRVVSNKQGVQLTEHSPWTSSPYISAVGTNHERGERIYPQWGPITQGEREYTHLAREPPDKDAALRRRRRGQRGADVRGGHETRGVHGAGGVGPSIEAGVHRTGGGGGGRNRPRPPYPPDGVADLALRGATRRFKSRPLRRYAMFKMSFDRHCGEWCDSPADCQ
eukprot:1194327-Prorocentrum_minimum.AAC.4